MASGVFCAFWRNPAWHMESLGWKPVDCEPEGMMATFLGHHGQLDISRKTAWLIWLCRSLNTCPLK